METNPKKQRQHFYRDYASGQWSMSELCGRYQISRPTGYKWVDRIEMEGLKAVDDRSRAPHRHPNRTPCGDRQGCDEVGNGVAVEINPKPDLLPTCLAIDAISSPDMRHLFSRKRRISSS
jgi:transposase-like protein